MRHRKSKATRTIVTFQPDKGEAIKMATWVKASRKNKYRDSDGNEEKIEHFKRR